jgi:5-methyltetrahydropteroyltriglutamate--homocysteine methyltransferase
VPTSSGACSARRSSSRRANASLGTSSPQLGFKRVEDRAVDDALRLQEESGLDVVTDGEMRRLSFQSQLVEAVEGFADWDLDAFLWGTWRSDELEDIKIERPPIAVVDRLRRERFLSAEEFTYTRGRTDRIVKVTFPSPSLFANFWDPDRSAAAYDSLESFHGDVAEILREEVAELIRLGERPTSNSTHPTTRC